MFNQNCFCERVKGLINERNITQKAVAFDISKQYKIKLGESSFSKALKGEQTVSAELLFALADYFGVSVEWLSGSEENRAPKTLADILKMLFTLQETSSIRHIGINDNNGGIYVSLPHNDLTCLDYSFVLNPVDELTPSEAEALYRNAFGEAVLYGFFLRWGKMLQYKESFEKDDPEAAQDSYCAWKEKMIRLASQYDIFGNPNTTIPKGNQLPLIQMLDTRLERIFDPYNEYPDSESRPIPQNARELFE